MALTASKSSHQMGPPSIATALALLTSPQALPSMHKATLLLVNTTLGLQKVPIPTAVSGSLLLTNPWSALCGASSTEWVPRLIPVAIFLSLITRAIEFACFDRNWQENYNR